MMNILVVEDDSEIAAFISNGLRKEGYAVKWAKDGLIGEQMARAAIYEAAIVGLIRPGQGGLTLIENRRKSKVRPPVNVLSAKRSVADKVTGLRHGADDYLAKPFDLPE